MYSRSLACLCPYMFLLNHYSSFFRSRAAGWTRRDWLIDSIALIYSRD